MKTINKFIKVLLGISLIFLFNSCHSKYLNLKIKKNKIISWNQDSSAFVFVATIKLYRMPVGVSKFPDGGQPKNEYLDVSLYYFDITTQKLSRFIGLNDLYLGVKNIRASRFSFDLQDSLLFYKLQKPDEFNMKYINEKKYPNFREDISKTYSINIGSHKRFVVDTSKFQHLFENKQGKFRSISTKSYLKDLTYADWGINIKELYPKSKSVYIDYIVKKEGNDEMRQIIIEQIISKFTEKDKAYIVDEMIKNKKLLLDEYNKIDKEQEPYQKTLKRGTYTGYINYTEDVKKKLNIPSTINKIAEQKAVLENLKKHGIKIPEDFKFNNLLVNDQGYDAEFRLQHVDSISIDKSQKWFRNQLAYLLNHKWEVDKQTKYLKPDSAGIVTNDGINYVWEHTVLEYKDEIHACFLDLSINYGIMNKDKSKYFTFSVSEECRKNEY